MCWKDVSDDIKRFVLISIPSIPFLEAALLLRNESGKAWDSRQVAQRLYMSEKAASKLLNELHEAGFAAIADETHMSYRYAPDSDDLRQMIDRLACTYSRHLVEVTKLIHSKCNNKAQPFADAFKWRKGS